ncbi:MAG: class I SAM-dependent methyltransferase [Gammaproteobacteria bacterium]
MLLRSIAIICSQSQFHTKAHAIAQRLQAPLLTEINTEYQFNLLVNAQGVALYCSEFPNLKPLTIDLLSSENQYRQRRVQHELLIRACALKKQDSLRVIDATAGLARDAALLASAGYEVLMLERSAVMSILLEDALQRAQTQFANLHLLHVNAIDYLQQLKSPAIPDVIYLDPMHPPRDKSALVKKEMRIVRELVGADEDITQLVFAALNTGIARVVLKLPRLAKLPQLPAPSFTLTGKNIRFDVYANRTYAKRIPKF